MAELPYKRVRIVTRVTEEELKLYLLKYGGYVQPLVDEIRKQRQEITQLKAIITDLEPVD
jgi:type II secretory pathway component PulM